MKIKFESDDNLPLGKLLNIPVCVLLNLIFKKTTNIIRKYFYINVYMSTNIKMKMILIPLHK